MDKRFILETQKIIKKYGSSNIIVISREDLKSSGLEVGDIVSVRLELIK